MEEILKKYFSVVFTEEFFTVALDYSGCYLFTKCSSDEEVKREYLQFKDDLALEEKQINLCVIGRESKFNYCSLEQLDKYVYGAQKHRGKALTQQEIESIQDTFGYVPEKSEVKKECFESELYRKLISKFVEVEEGEEPVLTMEQVEILCRVRIVSLSFLHHVGVTTEHAEEVLNTISRYSDTSTYTVLAPEPAEKIQGSARRFKVGVILSCLVVEVAVVVIGVIPYWCILFPWLVSACMSWRLMNDHSVKHYGLVTLLVAVALIVPIAFLGEHYWQEIVKVGKSLVDTVIIWKVKK